MRETATQWAERAAERGRIWFAESFPNMTAEQRCEYNLSRRFWQDMMRISEGFIGPFQV